MNSILADSEYEKLERRWRYLYTSLGLCDQSRLVCVSYGRENGKSIEWRQSLETSKWVYIPLPLTDSIRAQARKNAKIRFRLWVVVLRGNRKAMLPTCRTPWMIDWWSNFSRYPVVICHVWFQTAPGGSGILAPVGWGGYIAGKVHWGVLSTKDSIDK